MYYWGRTARLLYIGSWLSSPFIDEIHVAARNIKVLSITMQIQ
jgi:hypothetical protein